LFPTGLAVTIAVPISTSGNSNLLIGAGYRNTGWISSPFKAKMIAIAAANMPNEIKDAHATRDDWTAARLLNHRRAWPAEPPWGSLMI